MTATERLRAMLDERGVEWEDCGNGATYVEYNGEAWRFDYDEPFDQLGIVCLSGYTPEQAIAATLGAGTCRLESMHGYTDPYVATRYVVELSCHTLDDWPESEPPAYCPWCGAKIVGPTTNDVDGEVDA